MSEKSLIVVEGADKTAGRIVYSKLSGTVEVDTLIDYWLEKELPESMVPPHPTLEYALKRAFKELGARRMLVRPLGRGASGYALVHEDAKGKSLDHAVELVGEIVESKDSRQLKLTPADHPFAEQIRRRYMEAQDELDTRSFSQWFWGTIPKWVDAVCHRPKGGMYFVPRHKLEDWYKVVDVIKSVSDHKIFSIPAMYSDEAVEAILDAIVSEADDITTRLESEMKELQSEDKSCGIKALTKRVACCDATATKLEAYEELLDTKLDDIQEKVSSLQVFYTQAVLAKEAELEADEAAKGSL